MIMEQEYKPWWQSKTVVGILVAAISSVLAMFGIVANEPEVVELVLSGLTFLGLLMALFGRGVATKPVRFW